MIKHAFISCLVVGMAVASTANTQSLPPEGLVMKLEPVGIKIAETFVTKEIIHAYKKQLVQRIITAQPQYKGQENEVLAWLDKTFKLKDYLFYLGQSIGKKFTAEEENQIVAFLSTPVGKKFIQESNFISKESARVAAALVKKNLPTLSSFMNSKSIENNK